ncbi:glucose dehydrogenase-like protein [Leptotrombidium deliense]|uniref:Glucose dehydrogenase-like protein n=1 Tax=Leptotrombidium deliense TaxID=299467 RepID=A0A443S7C0_9ACAR|nr:glucose dehydrogenase-like protein [Leptotrombidium deliense]
MLGGSSCINGAIYIRAFQKDFETWVQSGAKNWDWKSVSPYYTRVETVMKPTKCCDCFHQKLNATAVNHCSENSQVFNSFVSEIIAKGGIDSTASYIPYTIDANGIRMTPFTNYLKPVMGIRNNLMKYVLVTFLSRPESVGFVRLRSIDPNEAPIIEANYLSAANDVKVISDGIKKVSQVLKSVGLTERQVMNCGEFNQESDEHWKCKAKMLGSGYFHAVGTCKMGSINSPESVVDEKLNVIGVKGLRVADASIFPTQIIANPQATVMMVAERVVDFIKENDYS